MKKKSKIKILYIIPSLNSGGAERFILDLIYHLDKNIFDIHLLLFHSSGFFYSEAMEQGVKVALLSKKFKVDFLNFFRIYREIKKIKPDIVHTQLGGDIHGKIAARLAGVKRIISTEQNVLLNDKKIITFFKKITASFSDKIVCISSAVQKDVLDIYKVPLDKAPIIFNGIDLNKFKAENGDLSGLDKNKKTFVLGSIGRLSSQKNFSLLFKALSYFPEIDFKCLIAGEGDLRPLLEKEIKDLGLESKVELLSLVRDIKGFLKSLDFFVLPSKWEGLGVVLLEAALSCLPVLASANGGILDVIKDQETGVLFVNEDLDDLVNKLKYFFDENNQDHLQVLANNLFNLVSNDFNIEKISQKYQNLYLDLTKE